MPLLETQPRLDPDSPENLYEQIAGWIRNQIGTGRLRVGEKLPSTRELAEKWKLNRITITSAYELLEGQGLVETRSNKGCFVVGSPQVAEIPVVNPAKEVESTIRFDSSRPAIELFPVDEFRQACQEVLAGDGAARVLQLGSPQGLPELREYLLAEAVAAGVAGPQDDVLITSGCQQAMDLIERMITADGEARVAIEDPVYPGVRNVFGKGRARLAGVPVGDHGMDLEALQSVLERQRTNLIVVTPSFQNPTGGTLPAQSREMLALLAERFGSLIVENGIYAGLRYLGESPLPVRHYDRERVLLLGSFSKLAFPGLRIGWVLGPKAMIARLTQIRHWCDLHSDQLSQAVLLHFARSGRLEQHRDRIVAEGAVRLDSMLSACREHLPKGSRWTHPEGGMSLWVELPEAIDATLALEDAQRRGVSYLPGRTFAVEKPAANALRLCFAGVEPARIHEGVRILGQVFRAHAGRRLAPVLENETALV